jgi:hypothetical protein
MIFKLSLWCEMKKNIRRHGIELNGLERLRQDSGLPACSEQSQNFVSQKLISRWKHLSIKGEVNCF